MAGELIRDYSAWVTLEASGGSIANNAFAQADDDTFDMSVDGGNRPHLQFEIEFAFGTAPVANASLGIFAQDLDLFGGADDAIAPSATNLQGFVEAVGVSSTTSTQRFRLDVFDAPINSAFWLQNAGSAQTVSSGWKLRARAFSLIKAP